MLKTTGVDTHWLICTVKLLQNVLQLQDRVPDYFNLIACIIFLELRTQRGAGTWPVGQLWPSLLSSGQPRSTTGLLVLLETQPRGRRGSTVDSGQWEATGLTPPDLLYGAQTWRP